jgi:two-component system sensor histidine kinase CiaH
MDKLSSIKANLRGDTGRLAVTYLLIILTLTLLFSAIIYGISSAQFDRPLPRSQLFGEVGFGSASRTDIQALFEQRAQEARLDLLASLAFLNIAVLAAGAVFSYILARRTLKPIEDVMSAQAQFVSDASHELRTPLTALQVTNEVALRKKKLTLTDAKELIRHNLDETIKLRMLSDALLGLAKQEVTVLTTEEIDIPTTLQALVNEVSPVAASKNISIRYVPQSLRAIVNEAALIQIVRIFIDNAIKYSPGGSTIELFTDKRGSDISIGVKDSGPGIERRYRQKIFDRFYRIDEARSSTETPGNGLGLAIAKAAAERNGYMITVDSTVGSGTIFAVHLKSEPAN